MNPFSEDDQPLSSFLRQNKPPVPAASPELEDRLMAAIAQLPQETVVLPKRSHPRRLLWLLPGAIAAGLVATMMSQRTFAPSANNSVETAELEAFIESTWHDPVTDPAADPVNDDLLLMPANTTTVN